MNLTNASDFNRLVHTFLHESGCLSMQEIEGLGLEDAVIKKGYK